MICKLDLNEFEKKNNRKNKSKPQKIKMREEGGEIKI